jgi:hypothetical protein
MGKKKKWRLCENKIQNSKEIKESTEVFPASLTTSRGPSTSLPTGDTKGIISLH